LTEVITAGANQKKKFPQSEAYNTQRNYELFVDLVYKMLAYEPDQRITPAEAMAHPFIAEIESIISAPASATSVTPMAMSPR
jgi:serine/threonine protein kinase